MIQRIDATHQQDYPRESAFHVAAAHLHLSWHFALMLIGVSIYLACTIALLDLVTLDPLLKYLTLPFFVAMLFAIIAVILILRGYNYGVHALHQVADQERFDRENIRRLGLHKAHTDAWIAMQPFAVTLPVESKPLIVQGKPIGEWDESFPTRRDLDYLIDQVDFANGRGLTLRAWLGRDMPSGKHLGDISDWHELLQPLVDVNAITPPTEQKRTQILIRDAAIVRALLDQAQAVAKA